MFEEYNVNNRSLCDPSIMYSLQITGFESIEDEDYSIKVGLGPSVIKDKARVGRRKHLASLT